MKLQKMLEKVDLGSPQAAIWKADPEISGLAYDSRKIQKGNLFFAVPGFKADGNAFANQALEAGAAGAVVSKLDAVEAKWRDRCLVASQPRRALAQASCNFYGHPSRALRVVGVTGTKGKTSSAFLLESILKARGARTALIGTVTCRHPGREFHSERTTMESLELQQFLREAVDAGADSLVMEVSSHALSLDRVFGVAFDAVLFTNLSEDHLDFYGSMEPYYEAKRLLFTQYNLPKNGVYPVGAANADDAYGRRLLKEANVKMVSYGRGTADYSGQQLTSKSSGIQGEVKFPSGEELALKSALSGEFNVSNILGAVALSHAWGIAPEPIQRGIEQLKEIDGRMQRVPTSLPFHVFVDFAHMGHALENVLRSLRPICKGRLIVVFGAGGDRDPSRRTQLGSTAAKLADFSVITSDNPRTEDPLKIIRAIEDAYIAARPDADGTFLVEPDRRGAIEKALRMAADGDVICIAGKGHETGQIIGTKEYPFDDREEAGKVLRQIEVDLNGKN